MSSRQLRTRVPRSIVPLALGLALGPGTLAGCQTRGSQPAASEPPAAAASTEESDERDSVARVDDKGELEPDPEQLAAGVPYLRFRVELDGSPSRGPADAPVTIVMFSDFECPYCEEALATIAGLEREYPDQLRLVYKSMPLARHPNALTAALVGYSAQAQGKFWEWHDLVFSGSDIEGETLARYAEQIGLDGEQVQAELDRLEYAPEVRRDLRVAKRLKLTSTPVFFINGRVLPGSRPPHVFRHLVEQELALAERLLDDGIAPEQLYAHATQWGYTAIEYSDARPELDEDTVFPVPVGDAPVRGRADAAITVVAFSDFQCPYCAAGHETMEELRTLYGDDIRFVFKHFPLPGHPLGALASRASFAARDAGKFWEFHDALFEFGARYDGQDLLAIAAELGIDRVAIEDAMLSEVHDGRIEADMRLGGQLGITGTPAYFINGRPMVGARPVLEFRMLIAEEFERVEALRAAGTAPERLYEALTGATQ